MKIVLVTFVDTNIRAGWRDLDTAREQGATDDLSAQVVGFCEDPDQYPDRIVLHLMVGAVGTHVSDMYVIPRESVKKVEVLR